jgi:hypothetical protein
MVCDGDEASVTYTLRAVDLNKFNINAGSGIVTYKTIPNVVTTTPDNIVITATGVINGVGLIGNTYPFIATGESRFCDVYAN